MIIYKMVIVVMAAAFVALLPRLQSIAPLDEPLNHRYSIFYDPPDVNSLHPVACFSGPKHGTHCDPMLGDMVPDFAHAN